MRISSPIHVFISEKLEPSLTISHQLPSVETMPHGLSHKAPGEVCQTVICFVEMFDLEMPPSEMPPLEMFPLLQTQLAKMGSHSWNILGPRSPEELCIELGCIMNGLFLFPTSC